MLDRFIEKVKIDWWEVNNLGWVGYFRYLIDWVKYLLGISSYRPDFFAYSEIDMDLDIGDDKMNK